jgi:hypothetical protein
MYNGIDPITVIMVASLSTKSTANNVAYGMKFQVNGASGTSINSSIQENTHTASPDQEHITIQCIYKLNWKDYVEIWTANVSGTQNIQTVRYNWTVLSLNVIDV